MAGRVKAEGVIAAVVAAYYGGRKGREGQALKPLVDVIERAAPGVVELGGTLDRPGFAVRLAERPFPEQYEEELRRATVAVLNAERQTDASGPAVQGVLGRLMGAIRRLFTASR